MYLSDHFLECLALIFICFNLVTDTVVSLVEDFHVLSVVHPWPLVLGAVEHGHPCQFAGRFAATTSVERRFKMKIARNSFVGFPHEWAVEAPDIICFLSLVRVTMSVNCLQLFLRPLGFLSSGSGIHRFGWRLSDGLGVSDGVQAQRGRFGDLRLCS